MIVDEQTRASVGEGRASVGEGMGRLQLRPALSFVGESATFILLGLEERPPKSQATAAGSAGHTPRAAGDRTGRRCRRGRNARGSRRRRSVRVRARERLGRAGSGDDAVLRC